jgi:hypothetical protein
MKTLVLYVFYKYDEKVKGFIEKAIFKDDNIDFMIVCSDLNYKIENLPDYVIYKNRENVGFDFGGWSYGLLIDNFYKNYDNYICVNASAVGPYVPENYKGKWTDFFINGLKDNVKLFGSTINKDVLPHIQTFIFSLEKETLEYLIRCEIFSLTKHYNEKWDIIMYKEISMSYLVIKNKWNIGCLIPHYKNTDFVKLFDNMDLDNKLVFGHPEYKSEDLMYNEYYKKYWTETDIIFYKGNRDIILR